MKDLKVYIDYKSPYAYIAKDATYALEQEFGIETVDKYDYQAKFPLPLAA